VDIVEEPAPSQAEKEVSQARTLGNEGNSDTLRLKEGAMWHVGRKRRPSLSNGSVNTSISRQRIS
jgi:hypothetical protein